MFKKKLIYVLIFTSIIPMVLMLLVSFYFTQSTLRNKISGIVEEDLIKTANSIQLYLTTFEKVIIQSAIDENFVENADNPDAILQKKMLALLYFHPDIRAVSVVGENNQFVYEEKKNYLSNSKIIDAYESHILRVSSNIQELNKVTYEPITLGDGEESIEMLNIFVRLVDLENFGLKLGTVVLTIDQRAFEPFCYPNGNRDSIDLGSSTTIIIDSNEQTVFNANHNYELDFKENHSIINSHYMKKYGWDIIKVTDENIIFREINAMQNTILITFLAVIVVEALLIGFILYNYKKSMDKVISTMKAVQEGELDIQLEHFQGDEFMVIAKNFNKMITKVKSLISETQQQSDVIIVAVGRQKEAEIRALEAQINPHFIYNTLDTINWVAIENEQHEISHMLRDLGSILRYSINESNKSVRVQDEVKWLKEYLALQRVRFSNSFSTEIKVEPTLKDFPIYKLLIQPFVENAILHGFAKTLNGGLLKIHIEEVNQKQDMYEGYVRISIVDNGQGFEENQLHRIADLNIKKVSFSEAQKMVGIGISNVMERLEGYYMGKAKLMIFNGQDGGACIEIYIPK